VIFPIFSPSEPITVRPCHWYASVICGIPERPFLQHWLAVLPVPPTRGTLVPRRN
jgi:hypothetical protein